MEKTQELEDISRKKIKLKEIVGYEVFKNPIGKRPYDSQKTLEILRESAAIVQDAIKNKRVKISKQAQIQYIAGITTKQDMQAVKNTEWYYINNASAFIEYFKGIGVYKKEKN